MSYLSPHASPRRPKLNQTHSPSPRNHRRSKTAGTPVRPSPSLRRGTVYKNNDTYEPGNDTVKVYVRVRPINKKEIHHGNRTCLDVDKAGNTVSLKFSNESRRFPFEFVADEDTTQEEVFDSVGQPMVENCLNGYNGAIFVYGQTGAGKTYTMHGKQTRDADGTLDGLVPRFLQELFDKIGDRNTDDVFYEVKCQYLEIYNEHIYDLLDPNATPQAVANPNRRARAKTRAMAGRPRATTNLKMRVRQGNVDVEHLIQKTLNGPSEAKQFLDFGNENRSVGMTKMNRESSRSHSIFSLIVVCNDSSGGDGIKRSRSSTIHLVDLAGSERQDKTHLSGTAMMKESSAINKSLSALGNVIMALADVAHGKSRHIPYRDSKLTFFLRNCLGGNAKTFIIANVSPSAYNFGETLSTLQFVQRAKHIRTTAVVNENILGSVQLLQKEVKRLKEELAIAKAERPEDVPVTGITHHPVYQQLVKSGPKSFALDKDPPADADQETILTHRVYQLEELLLRVFDEHGDLEKDNDKLSTKLLSKDDLVSRKDRMLQSARMVMKLREAEIDRLKGVIADPDKDGSTDPLVSQLRDEIGELQTQMKHNPDVTRLAIENLDLRYQLQEYTQNEGQVNEKVVAQLKAAVTTSHRLSLQVKQLIREKHSLKSALTTDSEAASPGPRRNVTCGSCGDAIEDPKNDESASEIAALKSRLRASEAANAQLREQLRGKHQSFPDNGNTKTNGGTQRANGPGTTAKRRSPNAKAGAGSSRSTSRGDTDLPPITKKSSHQAPLRGGGSKDSDSAARPGHRRNPSGFTEAPRGGVTPPPPESVDASPKVTPARDARGAIRLPRPGSVEIPETTDPEKSSTPVTAMLSSRSGKSVHFATEDSGEVLSDDSDFEAYS